MRDPIVVSAGFGMVRHARPRVGSPKKDRSQWCGMVQSNFNGTQRDGSVSLESLTTIENSLVPIAVNCDGKETPVREIPVICAPNCV
jgi:hypothetical protein